jgi:prepilin-type N-terminal cleavage/methylation domain-containing protein
MRGHKGFTLIELLVVIAIIAILAAILFPIFSNAKERGRQAKCLANLKQLTMAVRQYCDDHDGVMPIIYPTSSDTNNPNDWVGGYCHYQVQPKKGGIWPYIKSEGVYVCPTDANAKAWDIWYPTKYPTNYKLSYSMNQDIGSMPAQDPATVDDPNHNKVKLDAETTGRSSKVLMFIHEQRGEDKKAKPDGTGYYGINDGYFQYRGAVADLPSHIHYDGTTCSYVDGHCKWISFKQLKYESDALPGDMAVGNPNSDWLRNSQIDYYRKHGRTRP